MPKQRFVLLLEEETLNNFEKVAKADHLDSNDLAKLLISKFGDLRQGCGLSALTAIPQSLFKQRAGRPTASTSSTNRNIDESAEEYVTESGIRIKMGQGAKTPSAAS